MKKQFVSKKARLGSGKNLLKLKKQFKNCMKTLQTAFTT